MKLPNCLQNIYNNRYLSNMLNRSISAESIEGKHLNRKTIAASFKAILTNKYELMSIHVPTDNTQETIYTNITFKD